MEILICWYSKNSNSLEILVHQNSNNSHISEIMIIQICHKIWYVGIPLCQNSDNSDIFKITIHWNSDMSKFKYVEIPVLCNSDLCIIVIFWKVRYVKNSHTLEILIYQKFQCFRNSDALYVWCFRIWVIPVSEIPIHCNFDNSEIFICQNSNISKLQYYKNSNVLEPWYIRNSNTCEWSLNFRVNNIKMHLSSPSSAKSQISTGSRDRFYSMWMMHEMFIVTTLYLYCLIIGWFGYGQMRHMHLHSH